MSPASNILSAIPRPVVQHDRFAYRAITDRADFDWPDGKRLAVYIGLNLEHFDFGRGHGAALAAGRREPDVLNYAWREYGNRVGAWRMLSLFEALELPVGLIANSTIVDHCPELITAHRARLNTELIAHGRSNSESQNTFDDAGEAALIAESRDRLAEAFGERPDGWLGPWIAQSHATPDLLAEAGFGYHLDWCHDDQPTWMATRDGGRILSVSYPQEINDIPSIVAHHIDHREFAARIVDQFDEMCEQSREQPFRLRVLREALAHIAARRDAVWLTTPGAIATHFKTLF